MKCFYDSKLKIEAKKYKDKVEDDVRNGDRQSCYTALCLYCYSFIYYNYYFDSQAILMIYM